MAASHSEQAVPKWLERGGGGLAHLERRILVGAGWGAGVVGEDGVGDEPGC